MPESQISNFEYFVGVDEAGRGPLAGPVVASAVALKTDHFESCITDSKKMTPKKRVVAFHEIYEKAYVGVGIMNEAVIDDVNILQATFLAMQNAVLDLMTYIPAEIKSRDNFQKKVCLLVDGNRFKSSLPYAYKTIVGGDAKVKSIACASIIAKVTRDRFLHIYDKLLPEYGFKKHKGYPTREHKLAIKRLGPSLIQRRSFKY